LTTKGISSKKTFFYCKESELLKKSRMSEYETHFF
jgi:hypothetical protein